MAFSATGSAGPAGLAELRRRGPVVGPARGVLGDAPAELGERHHQDAVEQPFLSQILDERVEALAELLKQPVVTSLLGRVRVEPLHPPVLLTSGPSTLRTAPRRHLRAI